MRFRIAIDWAQEVGHSSGLPTTTLVFEHLIEGFPGLIETVVFMAEVYYSRRTCSRINKGKNSSGSQEESRLSLSKLSLQAEKMWGLAAQNALLPTAVKGSTVFLPRKVRLRLSPG